MPWAFFESEMAAVKSAASRQAKTSVRASNSKTNNNDKQTTQSSTVSNQIEAVITAVNSQS